MKCNKCKKTAMEIITGDSELKYVCFCEKEIEVIKIEQLQIQISQRKLKEKRNNKINELQNQYNKIISEIKHHRTNKNIDKKRTELINLEQEILLLQNINEK